MRMRSLVVSLAVAAACSATAALAVAPGTAAPDFTVTDSHGKAVRLSDYKGKYVVLE
jgi:cytochrome oxidase Cu insertion factor (SCO1/SenC/PrrC family)